jgi:hypothetical protein
MAAVTNNGSFPEGAEKQNHSNDFNELESVHSNEVVPPTYVERPRNPGTNAYMIYGHGADNIIPRANIPVFIVPPGCYIVVTAHIGGYGSYDQVPKNMKALAKLQTKYPDVITNPVKYIPQIEHAFPRMEGVSQSIVIYGPGDTCYDFSYTLAERYNTSFFSSYCGVKCIDGPDRQVPLTDLIPLE